jgi:hypothetical protein
MRTILAFDGSTSANTNGRQPGIVVTSTLIPANHLSARVRRSGFAKTSTGPMTQRRCRACAPAISQ